MQSSLQYFVGSIMIYFLSYELSRLAHNYMPGTAVEELLPKVSERDLDPRRCMQTYEIILSGVNDVLPLGKLTSEDMYNK